MPVTFNGTTLTITFAAGAGGLQTIDAQEDLYEPWKDWARAKENMGFPFAFRTIGGDSLTPGVKAGAYFFLQNDKGWRLQFPESDEEVTLTGNLAPEDSSVQVTNPAVGAFKSVLFGLQPITQNVAELLLFAQDATYDAAVSLDVTGAGFPGTEYPVGTVGTPCNTLSNALTIAARLGITSIILEGILTLDQAIIGFDIMGAGSTPVVNINGQDISGTHFDGVGIFGASPVLTLGAVIRNSNVVAPLTNFCGHLNNCAVSANITFQAGPSSITASSSAILGQVFPSMDLLSNSVTLSIRGHNGALELANVAHTDTIVNIDMNVGAIRLLSTCTDGLAVLRGTLDFDNQSAGTTVVREGMLDTKRQHIANMMMSGRAVVSGDDLTVTVYEEDLVTVLETYSISADGRIRTPT